MRTLKDLGALVADDAAARYFVKRANLGFANTMALGMGLQTPRIWHDAKQRYLDTKRQLALAAITPLGERLASIKEAERKIVSGRETRGTGTRSPAGQSPQERGLPPGWNPSSPHDHGFAEQFFDTPPHEAFGPVNKFGPSPPSAPEPPGKATGIHRFVTSGPINATHMVENLLSHAISGGVSGLLSMAHNAWKSRNFGPAREAILKDLKANDPIISRASEETIADAMSSMIRFAPVLSTDKNAVRSYLREAVMSGAGPNYSTIKSLADAENTVTGKGKRD